MATGTSPEALRQALHPRQRRGRIARGAGQWVIVPLMQAQSGAPPPEIWLHRFLASALKIPYYVGLLSAAEAYGVAPDAPSVIQVMVLKQRRPIAVGRQRLTFWAPRPLVADSEASIWPLEWKSGGRWRIAAAATGTRAGRPPERNHRADRNASSNRTTSNELRKPGTVGPGGTHASAASKASPRSSLPCPCV